MALIYVGPDLYRDMDLGIGNVSKKIKYQENLHKTVSLCFGLESGHSAVNTFLKSIYGRNLARIIWLTADSFNGSLTTCLDQYVPQKMVFCPPKTGIIFKKNPFFSHVNVEYTDPYMLLEWVLLLPVKSFSN